MGNSGNTKLEKFWEGVNFDIWENDRILFNYRGETYMGEVKIRYGLKVIELEGNTTIQEWAINDMIPGASSNLIDFDEFLSAYIGDELEIVDISNIYG